MPKQLDSRWCKHLKGKEKEDFEKRVKSCNDLLERLATIVNEMAASNSPSKKADYDSPSWAYKQADHNGYARAITNIKKLIDLAGE